MTSMSQDPIVVGVDGTPASDRAAQYAAAEAHRLELDLHLVHATPGERAAAPPLPIIPDGALRTHGRQHLEQAEAQAREIAPDIAIKTSLVPGGAVGTLVAGGDHASMLVLGIERTSWAGRIWTGTLISGVAATAPCPVVVVPPEWTPGQTRGRVVVGLKTVDRSEGLLRAGLELAHATDAELVIVNAWKLPHGYDDVVANHADVDEWGRRQSASIEPVVQNLRQDHHVVPVRIEVLHQQPSAALVDASAGADRLLITRARHGGPIHHLGSVARAVLRESRCPVEILPPAP